ncbi:uncharacterized protein CBL_03176 [Carabus blaptoides fortunei]
MKSLVLLLLLAACSKYDTEYLTIVTGATKLSDGGDVYKVSKGIYHERWDSNRIENDIAVLKTDRDIQLGGKVETIPLMTQEVPNGKKLMLSGWGYTSYPGTSSNELKFIELTSFPMDKCREAMQPDPLFNTQFCTFNKQGEGACRGDSGGPLVYLGQLAGVVSWGQPCAIGKPDVFTKVSAYIPWIQQNIAQ